MQAGTGARDPAAVRRPLAQRLPPLPRVAGGHDELDRVPADRRDAEDFASEESPPARQAIVRFETLYFIERPGARAPPQALPHETGRREGDGSRDQRASARWGGGAFGAARGFGIS